MKNVVSFFGTRAEDVLERYRLATESVQAVHQLNDQLQGLRDERTSLHRRHDREIEERSVQLRELNARLHESREQSTKLNVLRDRLASTLGSFWARFGISLRRLFSSASPSVQDLRKQLSSVSRKARKTDDRVDELTRSLEAKSVELRRLTVPLESVEYAIGSLQELQQTMRDRAKSQRSGIEQEIHDAVRSTSVLLLRSKLQMLPASLDRRALAIRVLRLKTILNQRDHRKQADGLAMAELGGDPLQRIVKAVNDGFYSGTGEATGQLLLNGDGRKHVQRTRRRNLSIGRTRTGANLNRPTETYWERVNVALSGKLSVNFSLPFPRWRGAPLINAMRDEANACFQIGAARMDTESSHDPTRKIQREIDEVTSEILTILESAAQSIAPGQG